MRVEDKIKLLDRDYKSFLNESSDNIDLENCIKNEKDSLIKLILEYSKKISINN